MVFLRRMSVKNKIVLIWLQADIHNRRNHNSKAKVKYQAKISPILKLTLRLVMTQRYWLTKWIIPLESLIQRTSAMSKRRSGSQTLRGTWAVHLTGQRNKKIRRWSPLCITCSARDSIREQTLMTFSMSGLTKCSQVWVAKLATKEININRPWAMKLNMTLRKVWALIPCLTANWMPLRRAAISWPTRASLRNAADKRFKQRRRKHLYEF